MNIKNASEFSGLPFVEQQRKIAAGIEILIGNGVHPQAWIAPGHSFDKITLSALSVTGITIISDGFSRLPWRDNFGHLWIPQQLWDFRRVPPGLYTVCFHINSWGNQDLERLKQNIVRFKREITSVPDVIEKYTLRKLAMSDRIFWAIYLLLFKTKKRLRFSRRLRL